jgi:N-acetylneuraminate synthase
MIDHIKINNRKIGPGEPAYIVAEMSGNHNQKFEIAVQILKSAKKAGANAIKLQTYTPDTLTIDCDNEYFRIGKGTIWEGRKLYDLYGDAYTPWEWQPKLKKIADEIGIDFFSTPFDFKSIEFLEELKVPAYKIASFEIIDLDLIRRVAKTGKPIIISTGMANISEIYEAVSTAREAGANEIALLRCNSAYPSPPEEMNLRTIPHMAEAFGVVVGLSDHTLGIAVPVAAVSIGASIIEKHITLSREIPGPDSAFSLEPHEFQTMVEAIRNVEKAMGSVSYGVGEKEAKSLIFRRSLFVVKDMKAGDVFTEENVRAIRPGYGLPPKYLKDILGMKAARDIKRGTPFHWKLIRG